MSNTWRTYGGMSKTKAISKFEIGTIITDNIIKRNKVSTNADQQVTDANLNIEGGNLRVDTNTAGEGGNIEANTNVITNRSGMFGEDIFIENRLYFVPDLVRRAIDNSLNFGTKNGMVLNQNSVGDAYLNYITGDSLTGNIGIGLDSPTTKFDVFGNIGSNTNADSSPFETMRVVTNNAAGRNTLIELSNNVYSSGIDVQAINENTYMNFYNQNTRGGQNNTDTRISYTSATDQFLLKNGDTSILLDDTNKAVSIDIGGNSVIDISSTAIGLNRHLLLGGGKTSTSVFDESLLIMDTSGGGSSFLESYFPDSSSNYKMGYGLTTVADEYDGSSNIMINMVSVNETNDIKGLAIGGGVHPTQRTKSVGFIGLHHESSSTTDTSFVPTGIIMEGNNSGYNRTTLGINTMTPKINDYTLDINGTTRIGHGETHIRYITSNQIYSIAFSKEDHLFGAATGSADSISNTQSQQSVYSYYVYVTNDGGQNWSKKLIVSNSQSSDKLEVYVSGSNNIYIITGSDSLNKQYHYSTDGGDNFNIHTLSTLLNGSDMGKLFVYTETTTTDNYAIISNDEPTLAGDVSLNYFKQGSISTTFNTLLVQGINEIVDIHGSGNIIYALGTSTIVRLQLSTTPTLDLSVLDTFNISNGGSADYASLYVYDISNVLAVGNNGCIAFTLDGNNWTTATSNIGNLYNAHMVGSNKAVSLYNNGGNIGIAYSDVSLGIWQVMNDEMLNKNGVHNMLTDHINTNTLLSTSSSKHFSISSTLIEYDNQPTQASSILYYNYYPTLLDNINHSVLDISGSISIGGSILPDNPGKYDLGTEATPFNNVFLRQVTVVPADDQASTVSSFLSLNDQGVLDMSGDLSMNGNIVISNGGDLLMDGNIVISNGWDLSMNGNIVMSDGGNIVMSNGVNIIQF